MSWRAAGSILIRLDTGVDAIKRGIDHNGGVVMGIFGLQRPHHFNRGIALIMRAEKDLHRAVIDPGRKSLEIARQLRLALMQQQRMVTAGLSARIPCGFA